MAVKAAPLSQKDEISALRDKIRVIQKHGAGLDDDQMEHCLEQERIKALQPEMERQRLERQAADAAIKRKEQQKVASAELGKRIIVSIDRARIKTLNPDGSVPCPHCNASLGHATTALMEIVDLIRGGKGGDLYNLIGEIRFASFQGIPAAHSGGVCSHCGAGVEVLVQLVL